MVVWPDGHLHPQWHVADNGLPDIHAGDSGSPAVEHHRDSFFGFVVSSLDLIWPLESVGQAIKIGFIWFFLTILFEFGFGRFIMKYSWKKLLYDYRIDKGRLWLLVLMWIFFAPVFIYYNNLLSHWS